MTVEERAAAPLPDIGIVVAGISKALGEIATTPETSWFAGGDREKRSRRQKGSQEEKASEAHV